MPNIPRAIRRAALAAALALAAASCGEGPLDAMLRSAEDPVVVAPEAESFAAELTIGLSWPADDRADEYLLERASGSVPAPAYELAYRGRETSYRETACIDQGLYLYRLTKLRGSRVFGPSAAVLGIGSATRRDPWEPNDAEGLATDLGYQKAANLYYYRSYGGLELRDADWYSLRLPPRMVAYVVVEQTLPALSGTEATWMLFAAEGQVPTPVLNGTPIALPNYAYGERRLAFEILPHAADFIGSGGPQGGNLIDYSLRLVRIDAL